jgi:hypothetical protein
MLTLEEFFADHDESRQLFEAVLRLAYEIGPASMKVTKSQIAFSHKRAFAWAWMPGKYLRRKVAPLVLSVSFPGRDPSPRWKQIVEPALGRFMHHLELYSVDDLDDEVKEWLRIAWENAG